MISINFDIEDNIADAKKAELKTAILRLNEIRNDMEYMINTEHANRFNENIEKLKRNLDNLKFSQLGEWNNGRNRSTDILEEQTKVKYLSLLG